MVVRPARKEAEPMGMSVDTLAERVEGIEKLNVVKMAAFEKRLETIEGAIAKMGWGIIAAVGGIALQLIMKMLKI